MNNEPCSREALLAMDLTCCPRHQVPVNKCPIELVEVVPQDKPHEGGDFAVSYYSVYCQNCNHPSMWHHSVNDVEGCRGFLCYCTNNVPGDPVSPTCGCGHPVAWHDKAGPACTFAGCLCERNRP